MRRYLAFVAAGLAFLWTAVPSLSQQSSSSGGGGTPTLFVGPTTGSANHYVIAAPIPANPAFALTNQYVVRFVASFTNTGASDLAVAGTTAKPFQTNTSGGLVALKGGEVISGNEYDATYNSTCDCYVLLTLPQSTINNNALTGTITSTQFNIGSAFVVTTTGQTLTLPAASTLSTNGFALIITRGVSVSLAPNAADGINGGTVNTSVTIPANQITWVTTTGTTGTTAFNAPLGPLAGSNITITQNANGTTTYASAGGGAITLTDGVHSQTSVTTLSVGNCLVTTNGSGGTAPLNLTVPDRSITTSGSVGAGDMCGAINLAATSGTPVLTLAAVSSTIFQPGMTVGVANTGTVPWTITNSSGLTLTGIGPSFLPGMSGTFVANADGTHLDFFGSGGPTTLTTGTSATLAGPRGYFVCTGPCTITVPVPVVGYEFCIMNDDSIAGAITLSALGSSARYENTSRSAYGTAGTGTFVSGGAIADKVCLLGRDATHYLTTSFNGSWTAN